MLVIGLFYSLWTCLTQASIIVFFDLLTLVLVRQTKCNDPAVTTRIRAEECFFLVCELILAALLLVVNNRNLCCPSAMIDLPSNNLFLFMTLVVFVRQVWSVGSGFEVGHQDQGVYRQGTMQCCALFFLYFLVSLC